jgi:hypothetical protein
MEKKLSTMMANEALAKMDAQAGRVRDVLLDWLAAQRTKDTAA